MLVDLQACNTSIIIATWVIWLICIYLYYQDMDNDNQLHNLYAKNTDIANLCVSMYTEEEVFSHEIPNCLW